MLNNFKRMAPALVVAVAILIAQPGPSQSLLPRDAQRAVEIGYDVYKILPGARRERLCRPPLFVENDPQPFLRAVRCSRDQRYLSISTGLLEAIRNIAHAKAIEEVDPGYFEAILPSLSNGELPAASHRRYWADDVLQEKESNFNQMLAAVIAIEYSRCYLGQYVNDQDGAAAARSLTREEWEKSVLRGAGDALDCGYGVEGLELLIDAVMAMPRRPEWTFSIFRPDVNMANLKRRLLHQEALFFQEQ